MWYRFIISSLKEKFPNIITQGIEPYKAGFERLKATKFITKKYATNYLKFEDFKPNKKYDIIYSVNVFEHLLN